MRRWGPWLLAIAAVVFLYLIRAILPPFIIAAIFAYILVPGVDALAERLRVRRVFVIVGLYLVFFASILLLFWYLQPVLLYEFRGVRRDGIEEMVRRAIVGLTGSEQFQILDNPFDASLIARAAVARLREIFNSPGTAFQYAQGIFQLGAEVLLTFIALFYLLLDWPSLMTFAFRLVPATERPRVTALVRQIHKILGAYLRGQLVLVAFVSALTWIALHFVFHVPFSLPIAIATGFLEIIPLVGPVVAAALAALSALSTPAGLNLAIAVIVFYTILRQVEDQLIAPNVLGRAVNVHPLAAIFSVLACGVLAGVLGLILGVPAAAAVKVILDTTQAPVEPEHPPHEEPTTAVVPSEKPTQQLQGEKR